jgi:hypothetical protein
MTDLQQQKQQGAGDAGVEHLANGTSSSSGNGPSPAAPAPSTAAAADAAMADLDYEPEALSQAEGAVLDAAAALLDTAAGVLKSYSRCLLEGGGCATSCCCCCTWMYPSAQRTQRAPREHCRIVAPLWIKGARSCATCDEAAAACVVRCVVPGCCLLRTGIPPHTHKHAHLHIRTQLCLSTSLLLIVLHALHHKWSPLQLFCYPAVLGVV